MSTMRFLAVLATGLLMISAANAQEDWPNRPVRIISTAAPGGTADRLSRIVAEQLSTAFKQQFFVEAHAGANGQIGAKAISDSTDLYTIGIVDISIMVLNPVSRPDPAFDPRKDLSAIAFVGAAPILFTVNPNSGIKSLNEFVERGKKQTLTYSSSGLGSVGHLLGQNFARLSGINVQHIPYKGAGPGLADLVGGHIDWSSQTLPPSAVYIRAGTLTGLAVSTAKRVPDLPDLPTFKEQGYDVEASVWFGLCGPSRMPPALIKKINEAVLGGLAKPDVIARMRTDGMVTDLMSPDRFGAFIDKEAKVWAPVMQASGLIEK